MWLFKTKQSNQTTTNNQFSAAVEPKKPARANILKVNRQKRSVSHTNRNGCSIQSIHRYNRETMNFISI